ncbi:HNH endonuclease [Synechococcus sp. PCC 7336]|uniref:HNH endonuclease n=1 Tax=Synechococcus sp. PCC 7336 TaxID=195250 RepID=UPI000475F072|nr:HNH endonuclease signature motif containing protein [Synechococcus sp. PCC 7336]
MARTKLSASVRQRVRQRAHYLCEYCHASEQWQYIRFTIDHVLPLSAGGDDTLDNLALACFHCNRRKSNQLTGIDLLTGKSTSLFHPRQMQWSDHFIWSADGLSIVGLTPTGRATVAVLVLNRQRTIAIRAADRQLDRHPPEGDPIQPS